MTALIIAGGRDFGDYDYLKLWCDCITRKMGNDITVISGHAKGADQLGEKYAKERDLKLEIFPADWDTYGTKAGPIRNKQMAERAIEFPNQRLIAFWDCTSRGTKNMITTANQYSMPTNIIFY